MISSSSEWLPTLVARDLRSCCFAYGINLYHLSLSRTIFALGLHLFRGGKLFRGMEHLQFLLRPFVCLLHAPAFTFHLGEGQKNLSWLFYWWHLGTCWICDTPSNQSHKGHRFGLSLPYPLPLHSTVGIKEQRQTALGRDLCWFGLG